MFYIFSSFENLQLFCILLSFFVFYKFLTSLGVRHLVFFSSLHMFLHDFNSQMCHIFSSFVRSSHLFTASHILAFFFIFIFFIFTFTTFFIFFELLSSGFLPCTRTPFTFKLFTRKRRLKRKEGRPSLPCTPCFSLYQNWKETSKPPDLKGLADHVPSSFILPPHPLLCCHSPSTVRERLSLL